MFQSPLQKEQKEKKLGSTLIKEIEEGGFSKVQIIGTTKRHRVYEDGYPVFDESGKPLEKSRDIWLYKTNRTKTFFVLKQVDKDELELTTKVAEKVGRLPSISTCIGHIVRKNVTYLVLEFLSGGESFLQIDKMFSNKEKSLKYVKDIVQAVYFLHLNRVGHFDLKPENVMFDEKGNAFVIDWDTAHFYSQEELGKRVSIKHCGTRGYFPPEMIKSIQRGKRMLETSYPLALDIFPLGLMIFAARTGFNFHLNETIEIGKYWTLHIYHNKFLKFFNEYRKELSQYINDQEAEMIGRMLQTDPSRRPTMVEVYEMFVGPIMEPVPVEMEKTVEKKMSVILEDLTIRDDMVTVCLNEVAEVNHCSPEVVAAGVSLRWKLNPVRAAREMVAVVKAASC